MVESTITTTVCHFTMDGPDQEGSLVDFTAVEVVLSHQLSGLSVVSALGDFPQGVSFQQ